MVGVAKGVYSFLPHSGFGAAPKGTGSYLVVGEVLVYSSGFLHPWVLVARPLRMEARKPILGLGLEPSTWHNGSAGAEARSPQG